MTKKIIKKGAKKGNLNYEIPSFIIGILSIIFGFLSPFAGLVLGIVGLVQSTKQRGLMSLKAKKLSIIGIIISVVMIILIFVFSIIGGNLGAFPTY